MNNRIKRLPVVAAAVFVIFSVGCEGPKRNLVLEEKIKPIRSILIVPVVNNTTQVNASDFFLSTISIPVAEKGYYVFPVNMVKRLLEDDGLADANLVHTADPRRLGELFGADAILYIQIQKWNAQYIVLKTMTTVTLTYTLKDARSGELIWEYTQQVSHQSGGGNSGNIIADLAAAAVEAALTKALEEQNCYDLACQANKMALIYPGHGVPNGPYLEPETSDGKQTQLSSVSMDK